MAPMTLSKQILKSVYNHDALAAIQKRYDRYDRAFNASSVSLWDEDLSEVKYGFDKLKMQGVKDFTQFFSDHPDEVLAFAKKIKIRGVNNATLSLFKAKTFNYLKNNIWDLFIKTSYDVLREELIALAEGKTEFSSESTILSFTGEELHILMNVSVLPGAEHTLSDVFVHITDISEFKRREEALRESETRYRLMFEDNPVAILMTDPESGIIINANNKAGELIGKSPDEIMGMHMVELHPRENINMNRRLFQDFVAEDKFVSPKLHMKHASGMEIPVTLYGQMIKLPNKALAAGVFICDPVTSEEENKSLPAVYLKNNISKREGEIIAFIASGLNSREIAKELFISHKTVETHRARIMRKLDVHKSVELVRKALKIGLLQEKRVR